MNTLLTITIMGLLFAPPLKEHFYLDPGSGSFILQLAIATVLGGLFVLKGYWGKIVGLFRKDKKEPEDTTEE